MPNVTIVDAANVGDTQVSIRGIVSTRDAESTFAYVVDGVLNTNPLETPVDDYLHAELRARLAKEPARFSLMMVIGELGDAFDDSTKPWPPHRKRISMGELTLDAVPEDQEADSEKMSFNPCLLTDGIDLSDDPVLRIRKQVYETSSDWRGGTPCPFSGSTKT